jgi:hypothetical protein
MKVAHPIDAEIRAWLESHVDNASALSIALGHGNSWLHKYINGQGHATIDDLVRLAGLLFGLNLPALTVAQRELLEAARELGDEDALRELTAMVRHKIRVRARRDESRESIEPKAHTPPATTRKVRDKR